MGKSYMVYRNYIPIKVLKTGDNVGPWNLLVPYQYSFSRFE